MKPVCQVIVNERADSCGARLCDLVVDVIKRVLYTGHIGDGKIFVYGVEKVFKVRIGEDDLLALTDREE